MVMICLIDCSSLLILVYLDRQDISLQPSLFPLNFSPSYLNHTSHCLHLLETRQLSPYWWPIAKSDNADRGASATTIGSESSLGRSVRCSWRRFAWLKLMADLATCYNCLDGAKNFATILKTRSSPVDHFKIALTSSIIITQPCTKLLWHLPVKAWHCLYWASVFSMLIAEELPLNKTPWLCFIDLKSVPTVSSHPQWKHKRERIKMSCKLDSSTTSGEGIHIGRSRVKWIRYGMETSLRNTQQVTPLHLPHWCFMTFSFCWPDKLPYSLNPTSWRQYHHQMLSKRSKGYNWWWKVPTMKLKILWSSLSPDTKHSSFRSKTWLNSRKTGGSQAAHLMDGKFQNW